MHGLPLARFFSALASNLVAAVLMLLFQRSALRWLRVMPEQFLALLLLSLCTSAGFDLISEGWPGSLLPVGFAVYLLPPFCMSVFGLWLSQRYSAWRLGFAPVILWLAADVILGLSQALVQLGGQQGWWSPQSLSWVPTVYTLLFAWPVLAVVVLFGRALSWRWWQNLAVAISLFLILFAWSLTFSDQRLWQRELEEEAEALPTSRLTEEQVWYAQPQLLQRALSSLQPERKGQVDWYFVGVGGASYQGVFRRETESVRALFDTRFATSGRSLVLINDDDTALSQPIATRTSLARALAAVGERMGPEDALFLFMTSHGSDDHEFELNYWPLQLEPITPDWLREALDAAGIQKRVIAISACYSGGFIPELETPWTVVMTASDAKSTSFGCSDEADFTYFGRALFDESLRRQHSLRAAFEEAKQVIREREQAQGYEASHPQLFVGEEMASALPGLEAALFPPAP